MRSRYPVSSKENQIEFRTMQENLIYVLGSDIEVFDNNIDVSGVYDVIDTQVASGVQAYIYDRFYKISVENDIQG